ncbi:MAG: hypothetical protein ACLT1B_03775 [Anaerobutyricum hallii]
MDKTIDRWTDPDGNGYAFKDTVARAQNRATIDKMNTETADRKSELDIERKRIDNLIQELPATAGEYQQSKLVLHSYDNTAVKCTTTSGNYTNVPAFTTDQGGPLSYLYTKKSNYQIAVNKSGLYLFELKIHVNSLTANKRVELAPFVNDTRIAALASSYNTAGNFTLTQVAALPLWLSANDTVDFRIAPIEATEVSLQLGDVLVYAIDWEDKFKIPDYTGYAAETKDIRTGADGTVYGTAGEAVRKQIGNLTEDLGDVESVTFTIEKGSTNVFDYTNITSGKILKQDIGISTSETYQDSAKGFVANQTWNVKKGDIIYTTSAYCGLCIYDANGVLQEHFNNGNKEHTITVDSAHFLRLYSASSSATYTTDFMLSINKPLSSEHEAYKPDKKISNFINLEEKINENGQNVKDLSKSVNGIELSKNLLDNSSVIANKRPSNWAGQTINDSYKTDGYHTFKAIPVTQNNTYYFVENGELINFGQLATYDKDGKYVSLLSPSVFNVNGANVGYIIPENIAYVRGESKTSNFSNVNFKLFNGRFEKKFLKYNESAYDGKNLPVIVFDFDQVVEIDARFTILKKYGFAGNVVETATNNYEITKELIKMGYDISPYLGNHTWDYSTEDGIQKLTANIAEKLGGLEAVGIYNPTMISCSGHKYSDTMEKILSSYKIDYVRCSGFIKDGVSKGKTMYENSYGTRIVVPIGLGSYNGVDEFNATIDSLVDGNVPLIMPFMHTFGYDADWITQEAFEKVVSHVSELVKNGKALCMNMHDFVAYNDAVKSIHDDYIRNMSAIFN